MEILKKIRKIPLFLIGQYNTRILKVSHQRKNMERARSKWEIIRANLPENPGTVLDIGCNEGFFTINAAKKGWFAWGFDLLENAIDYAVGTARKEGLNNVFFSEGGITPENVKKFPKFDVIFLLSIFQEICSKFSIEKGYEVFDDLLKICKGRLFFEPSSINRKYCKGERVFAVDNDFESINNWVGQLVSRSTGWKFQYIGKTAYTDNEPYRFMFLIEKKEQ